MSECGTMHSHVRIEIATGRLHCLACGALEERDGTPVLPVLDREAKLTLERDADLALLAEAREEGEP